jgi:hypothetical protein
MNYLHINGSNESVITMVAQGKVIVILFTAKREVI